MESTEKLRPKNHAEAVAISRAQVIAPLCVSALSRGDRTELLKELCGKDFMAPGAAAPRQYAVATFERWLYAWRVSGLAGLMPRRRSDRGHAQELNDEQRELLLAIRRENPATNATLILRYA
ncbi:MAG: helix-turn-helix domain-containing protein [Deltaproteobacteria bacterium]|nr:helix-turn-helix domain-containing protein [Deltaproteobacteria bacterium]